MAYIAYQYPNYGFYPEQAQYINTPFVTYKTSRTARGPYILNERLEYPLRSGNYISSYDSYCSALAAAGTKMVRIIWSGRQMQYDVRQYGFEPPPHGSYNIWHSALSDSNLSTFRTHQVSGSPGDASFPLSYWLNSNVKEFFDACESNGIEVIVEVSHNGEWNSHLWAYHPWNYNNLYGISHARCQVQDRGFLSDKTQALYDPQAIQAMKNRIDFIVGLIGGYKCVCMWGICSEGSWLCNEDFWGIAWGTEMVSNIRNYVSPWYAEIAGYIRSVDIYNRPIMSSVARARSDGTYPSGPDEFANVTNEPLMQYPIDVIGVNLYQRSFRNKILHVNAVRGKFHPKQLMIHQYYPEPWELGNNIPIRTEYSPYIDSRRVEWIGAVLKWGTGPGRWPGLVEIAHNNWIEGGYANPNWYSIGSVTATFRSYVNWKQWSGAQDWSGNTSSTGLSYSLTTGDGDHFAGLLVWASAGTKTLTISNVTDGAWTFRVFDWTDGAVMATSNPTASSNTVSVSVETSTYYQGIVLGSKD